MSDAERREFLVGACGWRIELTLPVPAQYSLPEVVAGVLEFLLEELDAELIEYQLLSDRVTATIRSHAISCARGSTEVPQSTEHWAGSVSLKEIGATGP